jgi:hypothetical protein
VWLTLAVFIVLQFAGPLLYRSLPDHQNRMFVLSWLVYTSLGVFACMFFFTVLGDLLIFISKWFLNPNQAENLERRHLLMTGGLALGASIVGIAQARTGPKVYSIDVPIEKLWNAPRKLDRFFVEFRGT